MAYPFLHPFGPVGLYVCALEKNDLFLLAGNLSEAISIIVWNCLPALFSLIGNAIISCMFLVFFSWLVILAREILMASDSSEQQTLQTPSDMHTTGLSVGWGGAGLGFTV